MCFSGTIVGWRAARTMRTDLPLDALEMALCQHRGLGCAVGRLAVMSAAAVGRGPQGKDGQSPTRVVPNIRVRRSTS